jgi:excinuclease ABC subunit C
VRFAQLISHLDSRPGIYMMLSQKMVPIYIGKAKDLQKRLKQYFQGKPQSHRIGVMLTLVHDIKVVITANEAEALVLENRLIKEHQPKYNVLLKDDKSFPYLCFSSHAFPRLQLTRAKALKGEKLYGPYTNQKQARVTLDQIQRVFQIRNCSDHFFRNRTRPCIQYEISRCTAPCVGYIDEDSYHQDIEDAKKLLCGENSASHEIVTKRMYQYAESEAFERAASCRDLLRGLLPPSAMASRGSQQHVFYSELLGTQIMVLMMQVVNDSVVHVDCDIIDTDGKYFESDWLSQYVYHYYQMFPMAPEVLLPVSDVAMLTLALKKNIRILDLDAKRHHGLKKLAQENLTAFMHAKSKELYQWPHFWQSLQFYLNQQVSKVVCVDVSHHQGSSTYVAMVVCGSQGMDKRNYRSYNMNTGGDDCRAIKLALEKKIKTGQIDEKTVLIIDGGKAQLNAAAEVLSEIGCVLTSVSKGVAREWGKEKFYQYQGGASQFRWPEDMIKYVLHIRDEAHHFAIMMHRRALRKLSIQSVLDQVQGIGRDKKKQILRYFGGLEQLQYAKLSEIERVPGVGKVLAQRIYDTLHVE